MKKKAFIEIGIFLLIFLFVYAAVNKLSDLNLFRTQLVRFPLLAKYAPIVAIGVPVLELGISISLMIPRYRLIGLLSSFILLAIFTIYLSAMLILFKKHLPCSCGGIISTLTWKQHFIFNLFFAGLALSAFRLQKYVNRSSHEYIPLKQ